MGRRFKEVIGGLDYYLSAPSDLSRILSVLPNGVPFWGNATTGILGSLPPANIDFVTDSWTLEFWFRLTTGAASGMVLGLTTQPIPTLNSQIVWQVFYDGATGKFIVGQYNTVPNYYRYCVSTASITVNTNFCVHAIMNAGAQPLIYLNNVNVTESGAGPSGTPNTVTTHKIYVRGWNASMGIAEPAIYKKALTVTERQNNINAMNAA